MDSKLFDDKKLFFVKVMLYAVIYPKKLFKAIKSGRKP